MATATGDVAYNFAAAANENPWSLADGGVGDPFVVRNGMTARIITNALRSDFNSNGYCCYVDQAIDQNDFEVKGETLQGGGSFGDQVGVGAINSSGNGYILWINGDLWRIYQIDAFVIGDGTNLNLSHTALDVISLQYSYSGGTATLTAKRNGSAVGLSVVDSTSPYNGDLQPCWFFNFDNSNAGGFRSIALDGLAVLGSTIDTLGDSNTTVRVGGTHSVTTTGLGTLTTASTIGGKTIASASATDGDGTITLQGFTSGQTYPAMGTQSCVMSDGTNTASADRTLDTMTGWQYVNVVGLNTGEWSLGKAFSGGDTPTQLHVINDGTGVLNADGTLTSWSTTGVYTCWARMAAAGSYSGGEMVSFTFTVTEGGVTVYNIKGAGGAVSSGTTKASLTKTVKPSGGIVSTGSSKTSVTKTVKASGGVTTTGASKNSLSKVYKAIGGIASSGAVKIVRLFKTAVSGSVTLGGSGKSYSLAGAITHIVRATGGVVSNGAAVLKRVFSNKASGSITTVGAAKVQTLYRWAMSGIVNVLGAAKASLTKKVLPNTTTATISGSARAQLVIGAVTYVVRGSGGVNSSGSAKSGKFTEYVIRAIGGVLSAGSALVVRGYQILANGAVSLSGKAKQLSLRSVLGSGGVLVSGSSLQESSLDYTANPQRVGSSGELGLSIFRTLKKKTMTIKDPDNVLDYGWDFTPELVKVNDTIQSATVIVAGGISYSRLTHDDYQVTAFISGGVVDKEASATFRINTVGGRVIDKTLYFTISQQ